MKDLPISDIRDLGQKNWYVLNYFCNGRPSPQKYIDDFNSEGHNIELFAPLFRPAQIVNGKIEYREKLLTFFYIFVKGVFEEIKELCLRPNNNLSLMLDHGSANRYAIISEADMDNFKIIARAHTNAIPFFNIEDVDLNEGDLVEVVEGEYSGLRGRFMPKSRSNKGNIVIATTAALGAILWNIDSKCIRILEFAQDTRRQYDLVDSFIPKILPILRKFHNEENLTDREKSSLNIFNQRMAVVSCANKKAEAKLLGILMCVQFILGDIDSLNNTRQRFEKRKSALTNVWTRAFIELIQSVAFGDMSRLKKAYESVKSSSEKLTNTQSLLIGEFEYYLLATPHE